MKGHENLKPFAKGDKRINRRGRPRDMAGLRKLAQSIAHESIGGKADLTVAEALLRKWAGSKDAKLQIKFVEYAYGRVPQPVEHGGNDGKDIILRILYGDDGTSDKTP